MRYRILYDIDNGADPAKPCGLIIEHDDHVQVICPAEKAMPSRISEPYPKLDISTLERVDYHPGHPEYFDLVSYSVGRTFAIGEEFTAEERAQVPVA